MAETLTNLLADLRSRLDETTATFWTDAELTRWLNEGAREVARRTECLQSTHQQNVTANTGDYTAPTNVIRIYRVEYWRSTNDVTPLEYRDLASVPWSFDRAQSSPRPLYYTLWGIPPTLTISLFPKPSETVTNGLRCWFYRMPTAMTTGANNVDLPDGWHELPVLYAEYVAMRKDRLPQWQEAKAAFDEKVQEMIVLTHRWSDQVPNYVGEPTGWGGLPHWLVASEDF